MDDATTPVISGIVVLLAGLLTFIVVVGGGSEAAGAGEVVGTPAVGASLSELDPAVERVLLSTGDAWIYQADAGTGLPAELARVLDAYQVPLMVPVGEGG